MNCSGSGNEMSEKFSKEELDTALNTRKNSTPGLDGIPYIMLKIFIQK
jgi:hypothetical protein